MVDRHVLPCHTRPQQQNWTNSSHTSRQITHSPVSPPSCNSQPALLFQDTLSAKVQESEPSSRRTNCRPPNQSYHSIDRSVIITSEVRDTVGGGGTNDCENKKYQSGDSVCAVCCLPLSETNAVPTVQVNARFSPPLFLPSNTNH